MTKKKANGSTPHNQFLEAQALAVVHRFEEFKKALVAREKVDLLLLLTDDIERLKEALCVV